MRILAVVGALAIIVGISAAVFFFGGFYSVAGTVEDPAIVRWALIQVRTASIDRHAQDQPPASINDLPACKRVPRHSPHTTARIAMARRASIGRSFRKGSTPIPRILRKSSIIARRPSCSG